MLVLGAAGAAVAFARCGGCYDDPQALLSVDNVMQCQKVSDFLISLAYFSIPLELFYFVTCAAIFPFRWIFLQFGAFIVLCGLTHFAAVFTYAPHSFLLMLVLTVLKFLTALVSVATAITLVPLIPQILRVFVREGLLRRKTRELDREVGLMKRQEEASWHLREITREIRRHLDRRTILDTALVELSKVLFLDNCAVWTADPAFPGNLVLQHEMKPRRRGRLLLTAAAEAAATVPIDDVEIDQIVRQNGVVFLGRNSKLLCGEDASSSGPAAAIRIPTLRGWNLGGDRSGNAPELVEESNTILVLVLPADGERVWTDHELEIIDVVVDQVAVALSHAAAVEDTLMMRQKLLERNAMLKRAQQEVVMANDARMRFRKVMSREMMAPVRSVAAILSALQLEKLKPEQVAMVKGGLVLSSLIEDEIDICRLEEGKLELNPRAFSLRPALEEAVTMAKLLCSCRGASFRYDVSGKINSRVVGDERRILQAILYMVAHVLGSGYQVSVLVLIHVEEGSQGAWKQGLCEDVIKLRIEVSRVISSGEDHAAATLQASGCDVSNRGLDITFCEQLAKLMNGSLSFGSMSQSQQKSMNLLIKLQSQRSAEGHIWPRYSCSEDNETTRTLLEGKRILLVDGDVLNRSISRKVLEKFGCHLAVASSWFECFENLYLKGNKFHLLLIDLCILNEEGQEIPARMRKLYSEGWLITIALVPKTDKDIQEQCTKTGVHGVIRKPIILQEMVNELSRITQRLQPSPAL